MAIKKILQEYSGAIGLALTLLGVAFSIVNFVILSKLAPITLRVTALEDYKVQTLPLVQDFFVVRTTVVRMEKTVDKIADRLGVLD